jgi:hypothetical protein
MKVCKGEGRNKVVSEGRIIEGKEEGEDQASKDLLWE